MLLTSTVTLDVQGNALAVTDARANVVQQDTVDRQGRVLHSTSPDAGETWQSIDADDQVSEVWKTGDLKLSTTFDALRRPTAIYRTVAATTVVVEAYVYGEPATGGYRKGRLWKRWDPSGYRELTYDFKGNVVAVDQQVVLPGIEADWTTTTGQLGSEVFRTETDVDALDRPVAQRSPGAAGASATALQAWTYTRRGLLQSVSVAPRGGALTPRIANITYDARGQRQELVRSDGVSDHVVTTYTYDPATFRLAKLKTTRPSGTGGTVLQDLSYVYDVVGNVAHKADAAQDTIYFANTMVTPEETYVYDALHRLLEATGRESVSGITVPADVPAFVGAMPATAAPSAMRRYLERYTYDAADNLETQHHFAGTVGQNPVWTRTFTVDSGSNRLVSTTDGSTTYPVTYNGRGAVTSLTHLPTMTRDHRDQLVGLQDAGATVTASYRYDADGQRVVRRVDKGAVTEERLYLGSTEVFRRYDLNGALVHERWSQWVSDGVARVLVLDQVGAVHDDADLPADEERWQLSDLLGSGVVEVDGSGAVICAEGYHPYGSTAWVSGKSEREVKSRRFRYTGKERDDESGLQAHGVRMYAPWLGRWMSADPIGLGDGLNRHLYVHANPVRGRDPSGTSGVDPDLDSDEQVTVAPAPPATPKLSNTDLRPYQRLGIDTPSEWLDVVLGRHAGAEAEIARQRAEEAPPEHPVMQLAEGFGAGENARSDSVYTTTGKVLGDFSSVKAAAKGNPLSLLPTALGILGRSLPGIVRAMGRRTRSGAPRGVQQLEGTAARETAERTAEASKGGGTRAFAHGTTAPSSADIGANKLSAAKAAEAEVGSYRPGAFYTHEIGPPGNPGPR